MTQPSCPQVYDTHFWLNPVSTWREHHVMSAWVTLVVFLCGFSKNLVTGFTFVNFNKCTSFCQKLENLHYWGNCPTYMYHDELKKRQREDKIFFFWIYTVAILNTKETTCTHTLYLENKLKNASQFLFIIYSQIIHWKTRMLDNLHKWHWTFYALLPLP